MLIKYLDKRFSTENLKSIENANRIIKQSKKDGYDLSLRQLYYQFVAENLISNTHKSYKALGELLNRARLGGMVSWHALEDRGRHVLGGGWNSGTVEDCLRSAASSFSVDPWEKQPNYVEVWIEKEALIDVVSKACTHYRVRHLATKGYNSVTEQWNAARRIATKMNDGKDVILIDLRDHDPSGIHMTEDNQTRMEIFLRKEAEGSKGTFKIQRLALNMEQVEHYKPPHNPAKEKDARFKEYRRRFGRKSWELDALKPEVINQMVQRRVKSLVDMKAWNSSMEEEKEGQDRINELADRE